MMKVNPKSTKNQSVMKLTLTKKLLLFTFSVILMTTLFAIVGTSYLIFTQTTGKNQILLQTAINNFNIRFDKEIPALLSHYERTINDINRSTQITMGARNDVWTWFEEGNHPFNELSKMKNLERFGFYVFKEGEPKEWLTLYYMDGLGMVDIICADEGVTPYYSQKPCKSKEYIHQLATYNDWGVYSPKLIDHQTGLPAMFPKNRAVIELDNQTKKAHLAAYLDYKSPVENIFYQEGEHVASFVIYKRFDFDLNDLNREMGVFFNIYGHSGKMLEGQIPMPDVSPELLGENLSLNAFTARDVDDTDQYDMVLVSLEFEGQTIGYISAAISQSATFEQIFETIQFLSLIGLLTLAIGSLLVTPFVTHFSHPIVNLNNVALEMASGNLNQQIPIESNDELGSLARSFAHMRDSINEKIQLIQEQNEDLGQKIKVIERQNVDLHKADQLKDEFLAVTSHELKTPIHGIIGIAESLLEVYENMDDYQKNNLSMIVFSCRRLSSLVNDLLDFHKINHNELKLFKKAIHFEKHVSIVMELCKPLIGKKDIQLFCQIPPDLQPIFADPARLEQILYNLIGNAIKFTQQGFVQLETKVEPNQLSVSVRDTGIGIPPAYHSKIFEPMEQGMASETREFEGAGLGLFIAKRFVELNGGTIHFESQEGVGSTFTFTIPLAIHPEAKPVMEMEASSLEIMPTVPELLPYPFPSQDTAPTANQKGQKHILLVDDDPINLQVLQNYLSTQQYQLTLLDNGSDAIEYVKETLPDLILLDIMMPKMSGYEVCRKIREQYDLMELPIVFLTAKKQLNDLVKGFQCGANDYLVKPFYKEELMTRVTTLLQAKEATLQRAEIEDLMEEINLRLEKESQLETSQQKLITMLDNTEDALICADEMGVITFTNLSARKLLGIFTEKLEVTEIDFFLPQLHFQEYVEKLSSIENSHFIRHKETVQTVVRKIDESEFEGYLFISAQNLENEKTFLVILKPMESVLALANAALQTNGTPASSQLSPLGDTLVELNKLIKTEKPEIPEEEADKKLELRKLSVTIMTNALSYWEQTTGETKIELAQKSKIWHVYLDRYSWQCRTLNKYLNLKTLPKHPRWRDVLRTAQFVLENCELDDKKQEHLGILVKEFEVKLYGMN